jgi:hypothetical protein
MVMVPWVKRLKETKYSSNFDVSREFEEISKATKDEPALIGYSVRDKNGVNPSVVCRKDGCIELFSSSEIGIRIDPKNQSIMLRAPYLHFLANEINFQTNVFNGMKWNKYPMILSPSLAPGMGTISPLNTMAQDGMKFLSRKLRSFGR